MKPRIRCDHPAAMGDTTLRCKHLRRRCETTKLQRQSEKGNTPTFEDGK